MPRTIRVLFVDDYSNYPKSLVGLLELYLREAENKFEFVFATNLDQAMETLIDAHEAGQDFEFVFSDLDMDKEDEGFELWQELKRLDWSESISFFIVTGRSGGPRGKGFESFRVITKDTQTAWVIYQFLTL